MNKIPKHLAIIMDGNGRWAQNRLLPRVVGHVKGASALKKLVYYCDTIGIKYLTVFAFGRENWNRPKTEVSFLMRLMLKRLEKELNEINKQNGKIRFIGDKTRIPKALAAKMLEAETLTKLNTGINFSICMDYSGQYDIIQALNTIIASGRQEPITIEEFARYLLTNELPDPELLIRTSGENRISNFMLWQLAYSEIYFSNSYWPDFTPKELDQAINWYNSRERRFGRTSEQLNNEEA